MSALSAEIASLEPIRPVRVAGSVTALRGLTLLVEGLPLPVGSLVTVHLGAGAGRIAGEVIGFEGDRAIVMTLGATTGVRAGDRVQGSPTAATARVGRQLLGRVVNGLGEPIDGKGVIHKLTPAPLTPPPIGALQRRAITEPLPTGVRAVDLMTTAGKGQRLGVFAGPGVGKSTMLGMIARNTEADVNVVALVGERGREVRDFLENSLGDEGLARSIVVVSTSDESPLLRIRAVWLACAVAEHFRDQGADVMLLMDSVTRFAQAQRQIGLAAGEPPATKGYTPSVFAMLPMLLERAGAIEGSGSITGFYTILVEGDDMTEPIADAARGVLDGHVVLSRAIAQRGHYPAVDVLESISRVADDVSSGPHIAAKIMLHRLLAAHRDVEDLLQIGAYASGSNPEADAAIKLKGDIDALLRQKVNETEPFERSVSRLTSLAEEAGKLMQAAQAMTASGRL